MRIVCPNPQRNNKSVNRSYPVVFTQTKKITQFPTQVERNLELYHALWSELHSTEMTPDQFNDWVKRVPQASCGCQRWLAEYLRDNPPDYEKFYDWGVRLHHAVSKKLGKPEWKATENA